MASALAAYVDKQVLVITQDGRTILGELKGFDQTTNVILSKSVERVYSLDEGVREEELGLYVVRGDNITLIGEFDEERDKEVDLESIRAEPIGEIIH
ncbi:LSM-domain-containing protein [Meredithblackwellia eburnea MCA 4105]